jgi:MoaA/NifB/PqqE/SkfB family radical SAM enzyme
MIRIAGRLLLETTPRLLANFVWKFGVNGARTVRRFRKEQAEGGMFPAFVFISVTNNCNLRCQGCWVTKTQPATDMSPGMLDRIISQSEARERRFFGILGGEPLMHRGLFDVLAAHPDCYFQLFTNGTLITPDTALAMRRLGNITPLVSIEGMESVSDVRRGGSDVYRRSMDGLALCRANRLITGVATSVCRSNLDDLVSESFLDRLAGLGVHYIWYYIYRPAGVNPSPQLALDVSQIQRLRRFLVDVRSTAPLIVVDAYWDQDGNAFCPASSGLSHHINPAGEIEPCPPIQFAADNVSDHDDIDATFAESSFLRAFRSGSAQLSRGCILMENPAKLRAIVEHAGARDSTGRGTGLQELSAMQPGPSHHLPGQEIPETSPFYRFAKRNLFFGFGGYG